MSEIAPTTAVSVLANPLAPPTASLLPPGLPATLPVQINELPPGLAPSVTQNPTSLVGELQLLPNGQATLQTPAGAVTLTLPQVRGNPTLLQAIKHYLSEHNTVTLQMQAAPSTGLSAAQLLFVPFASTVVRSTATPTTSPLSGQTLPALVLPADTPGGQARGATIASAPDAGTTHGDMQLEQKIETWLRQWLGEAALPNVVESTNLTADKLRRERLMEAAKAKQTPFTVTVQQLALSGQMPPTLRADEVLARVLRPAAADGALLVNVGEVNLLLKTNQTVPVGSQMVLKLLPPQPLSIDSQPTAAAHDWPALMELIGGGQGGILPPSGAWQNFLQHRVPRPDNALAGAMLVMLGAMRQQDTRVWLGKDNAAVLERGSYKALLEALQQELQQHGGTTTDAVVGDWRVYQLPLLDQQHLLPLQIYVHHNLQQRDGGQTQRVPAQEPSQQTRFVIDVTFSRLGAMQLDGFVKLQQFDLVLRTAQPLTQSLQQELHNAFQSAVLATGYQGQMLFQSGRQHWLHLAPQVHGSKQV